MVRLLDGNVLIALTDEAHVHHARARTWLHQLNDVFATCPSTQGTLLRHVMREGYSVQSALDGLVRITQLPRHEFWPDSITYQNVQLGRVIGHRQVTDAYLAQLARAHNGRLATLDAGLAALHLDVAELILMQSDGDSNGHTP